jgi:hypothetical protein
MSTFSIYWSVSAVNISKDFESRRNIKKQVLFPRYQGRVTDLDVVSAYVGSKEIDPKSTLNVIRTEDSISENSSSAFSGEVSWIGKTGYTSARYFLLTDVVGSYVSKGSEPFYWKHVLPSADIDPDSVAILDINLSEVHENSYYAERVAARDSSDIPISGSYESCSVYSNYVNSFDKEIGAYNIFFVRYTASGVTHYQILNPQAAFSPAGLEDISTVTGQLKTWRKVYISAVGPTSFIVTTPGGTTEYFLTALERSRIIVREPVDRSDEYPWFLNVSNGSFSTIRNSASFVYSVPEFSSQTFSPLYPYKLEADELANYLRSDLIRVDRSPMKVDDSLYEMQIIVKNADGQILYALTTDTSKDGDYYEEGGERVFRTLETDNAWVTWDASGIAGWDLEGGFIHLQREYPDTRYFYVSYYYEETGQEVTSLNVNPIFDEGYDGQFYVLYIIPIGGSNLATGSSASAQTASVQYIKVDRSGRVIETSQDGSGGNLDLSSIITDGEQYMYYSLSASTTLASATGIGDSYFEVTSNTSFPEAGILYWEDLLGNPVYKAYSSKSGTNLINFESYVTTEVLPIGHTIRLHSFVDPYTTAIETNGYQWLVLAEVHAGATSRVDELSIIDLRMNGGVIKDKYSETAMQTDARSLWARPEVIASRGQLIPGDSVAVVKVPYTVLTEYGGTFTKEQVESIVVERHLGTGIVPAIIFHGAIPNISSVSSTTSTVIVCWDSEGTDYSYNIYHAASPTGPWTKVNSTPYADQIYGNCYTITGLTSGIIYYIAVSSVNSDSIESPKGTPWGIKTRT